MRKASALTLAPLLALGFLVIGSGPANAFGTEVLGCSVDGAAWTANSPTTCTGGGNGAGSSHLIEFALHNTSGTYSYKWTVRDGFGNLLSAYDGAGDCRSTSSTCTVQVVQAYLDKYYTATVVLTQSGQSRTLSATAEIVGSCHARGTC